MNLAEQDNQDRKKDTSVRYADIESAVLEIKSEEEESPAWQVLDEVFDEICRDGRIERSFKASVQVGIDSDCTGRIDVTWKVKEEY